jgi:ABC-type polysaccharide/polyol phosphate export permease
MKKTSNPGLADIGLTLQKIDLAVYLGWLDVKQRYRRSKVGPFWITISMAVTILMIGLVFSQVLKSDITTYLPYLAIGIIVWNFVLATVTDSCNAFIDFRQVILERPLPLFFHIIRIVSKNTIIFAHNLVIVPILFLVLHIPIGLDAIYSVFGIVLLLTTLSWVALLLAIVCTRYRDLLQVIVSLMQVVFYFTPVIWMADQIPERYSALILKYNPFYYLLELVRGPLLSTPPSIQIWFVSFVMAVGGWVVTLFLFNKYRNRIPYWV